MRVRGREGVDRLDGRLVEVDQAVGAVGARVELRGEEIGAVRRARGATLPELDLMKGALVLAISFSQPIRQHASTPAACLLNERRPSAEKLEALVGQRPRAVSGGEAIEAGAPRSTGSVSDRGCSWPRTPRGMAGVGHRLIPPPPA